MTQQDRDTTERDVRARGTEPVSPKPTGEKHRLRDQAQTPGKYLDEPTPGYVAPAGTQAATGTVPTSTTEGGEGVAQAATQQVRHVAAETGSQVRGLVDATSRELRGQAGTQQHRAASGLRTLADDLAAMRRGDGSDRMAGQLVQQVSERAQQVADWLERRDPGQLLDEVRDYARRHPGTFLLGALAAGLLVGRLTRSMVSSDGSGTTGPPSSLREETRWAGERQLPGTAGTAASGAGRVTPDDLAYARGAALPREGEVPR
jgi:hypothetical protein